MIANIDDIKNLQLQGLSSFGFVGKSVAYPAQTFILDKITQSTDQAMYRTLYQNKNDYTINLVIDKVGRFQQAEWQVIVMALNIKNNMQVKIIPSKRPLAPQQPPVNNQGQTQSTPGMEVSVTNNSDWDVEISYTNANGGAQKKKVAAYSAADKAAQEPGAKVMIANIDDIKNLQLQGLSSFGFVGKSVAYPAQTFILDKITQSTDQAMYRTLYQNKNDYTINLVIDKVGRFQQAEWQVIVMALNIKNNIQVKIIPSKRPLAPQQPPVNNQ